MRFPLRYNAFDVFLVGDDGFAPDTLHSLSRCSRLQSTVDLSQHCAVLTPLGPQCGTPNAHATHAVVWLHSDSHDTLVPEGPRSTGILGRSPCGQLSPRVAGTPLAPPLATGPRETLRMPVYEVTTSKTVPLDASNDADTLYLRMRVYGRRKSVEW
jgi:hypothetical protein